MPLINVKLIEGVFDADEKREMIEKLTDAMVEIEGENMRGVTWVVIEEVKSGDWGIGGQPLTHRGRPLDQGRRPGLAMTLIADAAHPVSQGPRSPRVRLRRLGRRPHRLRGVRPGRGDAPPPPALVDRPLAVLEGAGPLPRPPLPRHHVRPARQRPLGPPATRRGLRPPRRTPRDALAVLDATGTARCVFVAHCALAARRPAARHRPSRACRRRRLHVARAAHLTRRSPSAPATPSTPRSTPTRAGRSPTATTGSRTSAATWSSSSAAASPSRTRRSRSRTRSAGARGLAGHARAHDRGAGHATSPARASCWGASAARSLVTQGDEDR